jgi:hypothetical protein
VRGHWTLIRATKPGHKRALFSDPQRIISQMHAGCPGLGLTPRMIQVGSGAGRTE